MIASLLRSLRPRMIGWGLLVVSGAACALAQTAATNAAAAVADQPVVELPKFEVTDSRVLPEPEKWRYAAIPGFEVLSSISVRETNRFVRDFFLLQAAINEIMPGFRASDVAVPSSLILTGRGKDFDRFMPKERDEERFRTNSLFFDDPERGAIVVDFALAELQLEDNTTEEADPYRGFYKEYFRYLIRKQMNGKPPPWFEEGLVQLFASIDVTKKWINFAQVGDGFGGPRSGDFNRILSQRHLMPFPELFADPPAQRGTFWSAQSYAFVHMCLYGRGQKYQKGFIKFLSRTGSEAPSEEVFKECFGKNYNQMGLELRGYLDFTDYKAMQYTAKKGQSLPDAPPFTLRDATEAESGRIVGEVLRMGGHSNESRQVLITPYIRGEREASLLAALGLAERLDGKDDRARKFLEAAAKAGVERPRAYLELARLRYAEVMTAPAAPGEKLSEVQVRLALEPLLIARKQRPPMAQVYGLIAEVWMKSVKPPSRPDFIMVLEGVQTFPRNVPLLLQATMLAATHKFGIEAHDLAAYGMKIARTASDRETFAMLQAAYTREGAPAFPAEKPAQPKKSESYLPKLP